MGCQVTSIAERSGGRSCAKKMAGKKPLWNEDHDWFKEAYRRWGQLEGKAEQVCVLKGYSCGGQKEKVKGPRKLKPQCPSGYSSNFVETPNKKGVDGGVKTLGQTEKQRIQSYTQLDWKRTKENTRQEGNSRTKSQWQVRLGRKTTALRSLQKGVEIDMMSTPRGLPFRGRWTSPKNGGWLKKRKWRPG